LNRLERLKLSQLDRDSVVDEAKWPDSEPTLSRCLTRLVGPSCGCGWVTARCRLGSLARTSSRIRVAQIARSLVLTRLREELRKSPSKVANTDVGKDLQLLEELNSVQSERERLAAGGKRPAWKRVQTSVIGAIGSHVLHCACARYHGCVVRFFWVQD